MNWKKLGKALLFPHIAVRVSLVPISTVFLVCSMVFLGTDSITAIISYVVSAYTLTIWCFRIPSLIEYIKKFKNENKYILRWKEDTRLRVNVSLYGSLAWNAAYAFLQLGMGLWHRSFWFLSLAGYYLFLSVMRFFLAVYIRRHNPGENMREELIRYRRIGKIFLAMNVSLSLMVFFMVYWNRTFVHHEVTAIMLATYTFTAFTKAIINIIKYRKYNSPVYSASKIVGLASASVSMLTLEATLLTTFGDGSTDIIMRKMLLGCTGGVISVFVILMAVYMITYSNKKLKELKIQKV